jgi:hypothetical protein
VVGNCVKKPYKHDGILDNYNLGIGHLLTKSAFRESMKAGTCEVNDIRRCKLLKM